MSFRAPLTVLVLTACLGTSACSWGLTKGPKSRSEPGDCTGSGEDYIAPVVDALLASALITLAVVMEPSSGRGEIGAPAAGANKEAAALVGGAFGLSAATGLIRVSQCREAKRNANDSHMSITSPQEKYDVAGIAR